MIVLTLYPTDCSPPVISSSDSTLSLLGGQYSQNLHISKEKIAET